MKTKQTLKRILAWVLSVVLVLSLTNGLTITSAAADGISYLDENGDEQTVADYTEVTSDTTTWDGSEDEAWYVVSGDVTISTRIIVSGTVNLILVDGASLAASEGIAVLEGNSFAVYGQTEGTGKLTAINTDALAGIGGGRYSDTPSGTITINGGIIDATGGEKAAGIGGGSYGPNGTIIINGGTVTATSGNQAAGIGAGQGGAAGTIIINGGIVKATGSDGGAGIGAGRNARVTTGNIIINGGTVTAISTSEGAGIGGARYNSVGNITINGGTVNATGGNAGAGIGVGNYGSGGEITINGGTVTATGGTNGAGIGGTDADVTIDGNVVAFVSGGITGGTDTITKGLVFYNSELGLLYGDSITTDFDWELPSGYDVALESSQSFTIASGSTLTNNGAIYVDYGATININGDITGTGDIYYEVVCANEELENLFEYISGVKEFAYTGASEISYDQYYAVEGAELSAVLEGYCCLQYVDGSGVVTTMTDCGICVLLVAHEWSETSYDWSEDGTSCTITITCANDETHVATVTGTYDDGFPSVTEDDFAVPISITYTAETESATCLDDSVTTYTVEGTIDADEAAAVSLLSVDVYDTKTVTNENTALGHDYSVTSSIDASCVAAGSNTYKCSRCDSTYTETVAALGHTFEDGVCTVCGLSVVTANEESPEEDQEPGVTTEEATTEEEAEATTFVSTGDKTPVTLLIMIFFQAFALAIAIRRRKLK